MSRELTKWPRLIVVGDKVTEEQANEILLRTNSWYLLTNDREWETTVYGLAGIPRKGEYSFPAPEEFEQEIRCLKLEYLGNARIASSWVGGPHGWCDWDGMIGCSNYNLGKWPSVEEITDDWRKIAEAWPFLNLRAQVVPEEGEAEEAAAEWHVHDGVVEGLDPGPILAEAKVDLEGWVFNILAPGGERGVSFSRLREAIEQVRSAMKS